MAKQQLTEFSLPTDGYLAFDALSLKSLIKQRLDDKTFFTDQNFEGSNMSAIIDVISYSYHVLLYYLNQTSTESLFTEAELYENINRIVKTLGYNPVGIQTSNLSFKASAKSELPVNTYTLPRYSFIDAGGVFFTFPEDITFNKSIAGTESIDTMSKENLLYQGLFEEYPTVLAKGQEFETLTLVPGDDVLIDHFNIHVYVKDATTAQWSQWNRASTLFLENSQAPVYEVRLNDNKRYELKFGNNITGKRLNSNDVVAIYYLKGTGKDGEVGIGSIDGTTLVQFNTVQFTEIFGQVKDKNINYITNDQTPLISFTNNVASSEYSEGESVSDIRQNAPNTFSSQHRLVTIGDYESYIKQQFSNIIKDVKVSNNWDYLDGHMKYLTETLSLRSANADANTLYNRVTFADSCDFNNIYIYAIPRIEKPTTAIVRANYLTSAQKSAIINSIRDVKTLTTETIVMDPVYTAIDLGIYNSSTETLVEAVKDNTKLQIIRKKNSTKSLRAISSAAHDVITRYFKDFNLGDILDVTNIVNDILTIEGVKSMHMVRTDTNQRIDGLSFLLWNPIYPDADISVITSNIRVPSFKYPYLNDPASLLDKIQVVPESTSTGLVEY